MRDQRQDHDEVKSLLGAYALDAVSPLEQVRIERHLRTCEACATEARVLGGAAAQLAVLAGEEDLPPGLVDSIVEALPGGASMTVLRPFLLVAAVAAAALIALSAMGGVYLRERSEHRRVMAIVAEAELVQRFEPVEGLQAHGTIYVTDDHALVILDGVPELEPDRTYQVWAIHDGQALSMDVIPAGGRIVRIVEWDGRGERFAVTVEPAGGSESPTSDPILISV